MARRHRPGRLRRLRRLHLQPQRPALALLLLLLLLHLLLLPGHLPLAVTLWRVQVHPVPAAVWRLCRPPPPTPPGPHS